MHTLLSVSLHLCSELLNDCTAKLYSIQDCRVIESGDCSWLNGCITLNDRCVHGSLTLYAAADTEVMQHGCCNHQLTCLVRWIQQRAARLVQAPEPWLPEAERSLNHDTSLRVRHVEGLLRVGCCCTETQRRHEPRFKWITRITYIHDSVFHH